MYANVEEVQGHLFSHVKPDYNLAIESAKTLKLGLDDPAINWVLITWAASYENNVDLLSILNESPNNGSKVHGQKR
jgi:hypothetical protein